MNRTNNLTTMDLIRARLLAAGDEGLPQNEITQAVKPLLPDSLTAGSVPQTLTETLSTLTTQGHITPLGPSRFMLTEAGRTEITVFLGLTQTIFPRSWPNLRDIDLQAPALGLPNPRTAQERKLLAKADGLRAAILIAHYQLPIGPYLERLSQVRNALLWWLLLTPEPEVAQRRGARWPAVIQQSFLQSAPKIMLNDLLGTARALSTDEVLKQLAAKAVGARRTDIRELRLAVIQRALADAGPNAVSSAADFDRARFAATVLRTAHATETGRFGSDKIFISHVWERMRAEGNDFGLNEATFKKRLAEANNQGLLRLSRADLAQSLDQNDVTRSETGYLTATFHFIRLD